MSATRQDTQQALAELQQRHSARREEIIGRFRQRAVSLRASAAPLVGALSALTDATLSELWSIVQMPTDGALLAVGGYGRAQQFPHSDVDLLILLPQSDSDTSAAERFVTACWDLRLEIGHSVRSVEQCCAEAAGDLTVRTALLETRRITGRAAPARQLAERLRAQLDVDDFIRDKTLEMRQRHVKFEDTPYSLEPNCKESPGGLRDLHLLAWVAKAAGLGNSWRDLAARGLLTHAELLAIARNERILMLIRGHLHLLAGRREDRLVFDLQTPLARTLGFNEQSDRRASEALMQRYYWAAKAVTQLCTIVLQNMTALRTPAQADEVAPIDARFRNRGGLLDIVDDRVFAREPSALLHAFLTLGQHPELTGMTAQTMRAIWRDRMLIDARFRRDPVNRKLFMQILRAPRGITHTLRRMNQLSVLGRYLPVFRRIIGRMQHDLFHVYTVDQHILMVVRNVRRFTMAQHAHEYPFCSELMAGFDAPWLIYVAALFHDIAKGRGGDHSALGKLDALRFARDHGLAKTDAEFIAFLVEHHLTMSTVAQKHDLSDPATIESFAALVGDERRLTALYLLTVADIRGTSPKVWNAWKGKLLEDLFRATKRVLRGERAEPTEMVDACRAEAVRLLNLYGLDSGAYAPFWQQLDRSYFLRNEASDVAWQTRVLYRHVDSPSALVRTRLAPIGEGFQVVIYARDEPALFARICGYFDSKNLSVLDARINTSRSAYALDSFLVVDPSVEAVAGAAGTPYRDILNLVEVELAENLRDHRPLPAPVRGRMSRRSRSFPIQPSIDLRPDERGQHYLLTVTANDRTGLLYSIAKVLAERGINLSAARILTLGERVEDAFQIEGEALSRARAQIELEAALLDAIQVNR